MTIRFERDRPVGRVSYWPTHPSTGFGFVNTAAAFDKDIEPPRLVFEGK